MNNEELIKLAKNGDTEAYNQLFINNDRLIWDIAHKFSHTGIELSDLYSLAALGMLKAYHKFDINRGLKFTTYCVKSMRNEILSFLRKYNRNYGKEVFFEDTFQVGTNGENLPLLDVLESDKPDPCDFLVMAEKFQFVYEFMQKLTEKERLVFQKCIIENKSELSQVNVIGISQPHISRIKKKILKRLREAYEKDNFKLSALSKKAV